MENPESTNLRKYESKNPFKQLALDKFYQALAEMPFVAEAILDAGCGEGFGASRLQETFPDASITGIDFSFPALVHSAQIAPQREVGQADVTRLPFPEKQFDAVVSLDVLEHLPRPELAVAAYKLATRRYLLLSVPNEPIFRTVRMLEGNDILKWGDHPEHINHWNIFSFSAFLKKQGLRVIARQVPFPFVWSLVLCELDN